MHRLSINVLELLEMVMTAFMMIVNRRDRPGRVGEPVLIWGYSWPAVQWVKNCKWGKSGSETGKNDESFGGIGADKGMVLPGKEREGRGERVSKRDTEMEGRQNPIEAEQRMPRRLGAGPRAWSGRSGDVFGDFARGCGLGCVAKSTL